MGLPGATVSVQIPGEHGESQPYIRIGDDGQTTENGECIQWHMVSWKNSGRAESPSSRERW